LFNNCRTVQAQSFVNPQAGSHAQDQVGPFAARAEDENRIVAFLMAVQHRGTKWTPEEDRRLLELIEAGKSLVFISANLKRPVKTIRARVSRMRRSKLKAKGK
jgi:DNA-binding NarL/FixJ family response regulator